MDRSRPIQPDATRRRLLLVGAGLALAAILGMIPPRLADLVRAPIGAALAPAQRGLATLRRTGGSAMRQVRAQFASAETAARTDGESRRLAEENRRLKAELQSVRDQLRLLGDRAEGAPPLLAAQCIPARVLGAAAQSYLARHHLLDAGWAQGAEPGDLVLRPAPYLVDRGTSAGVENGNLVLAGSCVWGKIVSVGSHTSTVCPMTEPGYRDLVCLATTGAPSRQLRLGARGILEGTGEPLARLRMIETTEPVAEGDFVVSMAGQGFVDLPLVCGKVVRVERPHGAGHWEIWVAPAADETAERLAILCPAASGPEPARHGDKAAGSPGLE